MGQRANYVIKDGDKIAIYYHHWRAHTVGADLYLGEKRFLDFVQSCKPSEVLLDEVWMEACVIADVAEKRLYFWALEMSYEAPVLDYYVSRLQSKWDGWQVKRLLHQMYDVERILGIDYLSTQEIVPARQISIEKVMEEDDWSSRLVVLRDADGTFITSTGSLSLEDMMCYGPGVLDLLKHREPYTLTADSLHDLDGVYECIVFDAGEKKIVVSDCVFGLWEKSSALWPGFHFVMGDLGIIMTLDMAGIDTTLLQMTEQEVTEGFNEIIGQSESFDVEGFASTLEAEGNDVQFNPNFFDNRAPRKTTVEKLKVWLKRFF